jgi:hypothetical protein
LENRIEREKLLKLDNGFYDQNEAKNWYFLVKKLNVICQEIENLEKDIKSK